MSMWKPTFLEFGPLYNIDNISKMCLHELYEMQQKYVKNTQDQLQIIQSSVTGLKTL